MSARTQRRTTHKLRVFEHAEKNKSIAFTCLYFGISRDTFYHWGKNYKNKGKQGLISSKSCTENHKPIEDNILFLYKNITLDSYILAGIYNAIMKLKFHLIDSTYPVLKRNGVNGLAQNQCKYSTPEVKGHKKQVLGIMFRLM